jgi:hypothetical protein
MELTEPPVQLIVAVLLITSVKPLDEVLPLNGTKSGEPGSAAATPAAAGPRAETASIAVADSQARRLRAPARRRGSAWAFIVGSPSAVIE